jgi:hypothetical protein
MLVDNEVNGSSGPLKEFIEASDGVAEQPEIIQVDVQDARHAICHCNQAGLPTRFGSEKPAYRKMARVRFGRGFRQHSSYLSP